jgi:hypothetical protein
VLTGKRLFQGEDGGLTHDLVQRGPVIHD